MKIKAIRTEPELYISQDKAYEVLYEYQFTYEIVADNGNTRCIPKYYFEPVLEEAVVTTPTVSLELEHLCPEDRLKVLSPKQFGIEEFCEDCQIVLLSTIFGGIANVGNTND